MGTKKKGGVASSEIPRRNFTEAAFSKGLAAEFGAAWIGYRFQVSDDTWYPLDLLRPGQRPSAIALRFGTLPQWMHSEAKRFIGSKWLNSSHAATTLVGFISALSHLGRVVPEFNGTFLDLSKRESDRLRDYFGESFDAGKLQARTARYAASRIRRVRDFLLSLPENEAATCDFDPRVPKRLKANQQPLFGADPKKVLTATAVAKLLEACRAEERAYERFIAWDKAVRNADGRRLSSHTLRKRGLEWGMPHGYTLRNRAMKAQVIKLALALGRRGNSILTVGPAVEREEALLSGEAVLRVWPTEYKITEMPEPVVAVGYFAKVAANAIRKAHSYGATARVNSGRAAEFLFVVDGVRGGAGPITVMALNQYLNSPGGLLDRYGIRPDGAVENITTHDFRTTRLTWIVEGGGSLPVAQQDAGHLDILTTGRFYVAGTPKVVRAAEQSLRSGAASGDVWDMIHGKPVGERIHPLLIDRLMEGPNPLVANAVRYGVCFLPAETGPCVTANPCWLGPEPDSPAVQAGRACPWLVVTKGSLVELERDAELLDYQIERYRSDSRFTHWIGHLQTRRRVLNQVISRAKNPNRFLPILKIG